MPLHWLLALSGGLPPGREGGTLYKTFTSALAWSATSTELLIAEAQALRVKPATAASSASNGLACDPVIRHKGLLQLLPNNKPQAKLKKDLHKQVDREVGVFISGTL